MPHPQLTQKDAEKMQHEGNGIYRCRLCEYRGSRAAVRLHYAREHQGRLPRRPPDGLQIGMPVPPTSGHTQPECAHQWRILSPRRPAEAAALRAGYRLVCARCGALRGAENA